MGLNFSTLVITVLQARKHQRQQQQKEEEELLREKAEHGQKRSVRPAHVSPQSKLSFKLLRLRRRRFRTESSESVALATIPEFSSGNSSVSVERQPLMAPSAS